MKRGRVKHERTECNHSLSSGGRGEGGKAVEGGEAGEDEGGGRGRVCVTRL